MPPVSQPCRVFCVQRLRFFLKRLPLANSADGCSRRETGNVQGVYAIDSAPETGAPFNKIVSGEHQYPRGASRSIRAETRERVGETGYPQGA